MRHHHWVVKMVVPETPAVCRWMGNIPCRMSQLLTVLFIAYCKYRNDRIWYSLYVPLEGGSINHFTEWYTYQLLYYLLDHTHGVQQHVTSTTLFLIFKIPFYIPNSNIYWHHPSHSGTLFSSVEEQWHTIGKYVPYVYHSNSCSGDVPRNYKSQMATAK